MKYKLIWVRGNSNFRESPSKLPKNTQIVYDKSTNKTILELRL